MLLRISLATLLCSASLGAALAGDGPSANAEIFLRLDYASDTGAQGDGVTKYAAPLVAGYAPRDAVVEVLKDGKVIAKSKAPADGWGKWQAQLPKLGEGRHLLQARAKLGGKTYSSNSLRLVIDLTPPAPPKLRFSKGYVEDGTSPHRTLPIEGTSEKGASRVEVRVDKGSSRLVTVRRSGTWKTKLPELRPGDRSITAVVYDAAGNRSKRSQPLNVRIVVLRDSVRLDRLDGKDGTALWVRGFNSCSQAVAATDIDGDGLSDVLLGGAWAEPSDEGGQPRGKLVGVMGTNKPWLARFDASALPAGAGFAVTGSQRNQLEYARVASAGDINGDGYGDFALAARSTRGDGDNSGLLVVLYGGKGGFPATIDVRDVKPKQGFSITGRGEDRGPDYPVGVGDLDGDGIDDLAFRAGDTLHVLFGKRGTDRGDLMLSDLGHEDGIQLRLDNASTGASVSGGDIDGDGHSDLLIGVAGGRKPGSINIIFGGGKLPSDTKLVDAAKARGVHIPGAAAEFEGMSVAAGFDLNGDGRGDFVALADQGAVGRQSGKGVVLYGAARKKLETIDLRGQIGPETGFRLVGGTGWNIQSAAAAGDFNGDRLDDLILGAYNNLEDIGYVLFGRSERRSEMVYPGEFDGIDGFRLTYGGRQPSIDTPGCTVAGAGDVNGDGIDDILVSGGTGNRIQQRGSAGYVVFGRRE